MTRFPDGTLFVRDFERTDLAFHEGEVACDVGEIFHFGFRRDTAEQVRDLRGELIAQGIDLVALDDERDVVSLKLRDPNGYVVEVYLES